MKYMILSLVSGFFSFHLISGNMAIRRNYALFLDTEGQVWSIGNNEDYQLGLKNKAVLDKLQRVDVVGSDIVKIATLGSSTFFLSSEENVFASGKNHSGQLGLGGGSSTKSLQQIENLSNIIQIIIDDEATDDSTFFLSSKGNVFATGNNRLGQLGLGDKVMVDVPHIVEKLTNITQVVASNSSAFFLNDEGEVFATGVNSDGQLGLGNEDDVDTPHLVNALVGTFIIQAVTGSGSTFFLSNKGEIFATGVNSDGQLGLGNEDDVDTPHLVNALVGTFIIQGVTGNGSTFFLSDEGKVFATGKNDNGQLGLGHKENVNTPHLVNALVGSSIIQAVTRNGSTFFLSDEGEVFVTGKNNNGQLGVEGNHNVEIPTKITVPQSVPVVQIKNEFAYVLLLDEEGDVYFTGSVPWSMKSLGLTKGNIIRTPIKLHLPFKVMPPATKKGPRIKSATSGDIQ